MRKLTTRGFSALLFVVLLTPTMLLGQDLIGANVNPDQNGINTAKERGKSKQYRYVRLNTRALASQSLDLDLFPDASFKAQRKGGKRHLNTNVWTGDVQNEAFSSVILSLHDTGVLFGKIEVGDRTFFIRHKAGPIYAIVEHDPDKQQQNESVGDDFIIEGAEDSSEPGSELDMSLGKLQADSACLPGTSCATQTVDIMVVYTAAARGALGGTTPLAEAEIATAVAEMNSALSNAGVSHSFNLVFAGEVAYTETGNANTDLSRLSGDGDGYLDVVHGLRDAYGADIVSLITDTGGCGIGYVPGTPTNLTSTSGFNTVRDDCLTGNKTLAHEVGHNMGLHHDWYVNSSTTPCEWHHGYVNQAAIGGSTSQRWRTIMAYNDNCSANGFNCTRLTYYSNPNNTYTSDDMGVDQGQLNPADAAFGLERTMCQIADHRTAAVSPAPIADFSATPLSGAPSLFVSFTDESFLSPTSWSWDFGDGNTSTLQNPSHTYTTPGLYTVNLMVTNANGSDTMTKTNYVTVTGFDVATFQEGVDSYTGAKDTRIDGSTTTTNYGTNIELQTDGSPDIAALMYWDISSIPAGSDVVGVAVDLGITNSSVSPYDFFEMKRPWVENEATWLQYASGQSWQSSGAQGANDIGATVLGSLSATSSGGIVSSALNTDAEALVESWINTPSSNNGLILADYITSGDGIYFSSREAATPGDRPKLTVYYVPPSSVPPVAEFIADVTSGPQNTTVNFTDQSSFSPTSWSWDFGDTGSSTLQNPSHQYTSPGFYTVSLTATNADGSDVETKTNYIEITSVSPPVAAFSADVTSGPPTLNVNFTDESSNSPTSWDWDFGDGNTSTSQNPSHGYSSPGFYTVTLTATNAGGSDDSTRTAYIAVHGLVAEAFQQGLNSYAGARDTKIKSDVPTTNFGSDLTLEADGSPDYGVLLGWDLSTIPAGAIVTGVNLTINVTDPTTDSYELYEMKRAWVESEATFQQYATGQSWQTAGGDGSNDRGSTVLGSFSAPTGLQTISLNSDGKALVQTWIDNPGSNNGFIMLDYSSAANGIDFDSKEVGTVAHRPKLTVSYSTGGNLPPVAAFDATPIVGNAPLNVSFDATDSDDSDGSISSYAWSFGDGNSGSGVSASNEYAAGEYTAQLIVTDNDGASDTTYQQIHAVTPGPITFAVLGDFGDAGTAEANVATQVNSWNPDFIITAGDNNYSSGEASTIDPNIGQYYSNYIYPYTGSYGSTATTNRFFPSPGNHDWISISCSSGSCSGPYFDYFDLPTSQGDERYYDFVWGDVHFFSINSNSAEPDGISSTSTQATWLQNALAASTSQWKVVYFHHAAYSSSSNHGSNTTMQWPFAAWGADVVIGGHDHTYERIFRDGIVYFVNGLGGRSLYGLGTPIAGSQVQYNSDYGAQLVTASADSINFKFITRTGAVIDSYTLAKPTAAFTADVTSGSVPLTVNFTDQSTQSPTSWSWDFGDGGSSTSQNPSHEYTTPGLYAVTLTATNQHGSDDEVKTDYINVGALTPPVAAFSADTTFGEAPLTVVFTDESTNTPTSWSWDFGDTGSSTEQNPSHQYTTPGLYTVTLTATNADGSDDEVKTDYINILLPPVAAFSADTTFGAPPLTVTFTDESTNTPTSWSWDFGDTGTSTEQNPSHEYTTPGLYTVTLTATNADGSDDEVKTDYINILAPPVAEFSADTTSGKPPLTVTFTDESTNTPTSWAWDFGDTGTSTEQNPSHEYTTPGLYTVTLTATNADGSDDEVKVDYINIMALMPPVAGFSADTTSGKPPLTVTFTDESTNSPTSWSWTFGDGGTSTAQNPSHEYTTPGLYTVTLTATNPDGSDGETKTDYINIMALMPPVAGFSADTTSGKPPLTVTFTDESTNSPASWSWTFGDGGTSTDQNPSHEYTASGLYTVTLTATNDDGSDGETKTDYISILELMPPVAAFSADDTSGAAPLTVNFTDESTNTPTSWSWDFGDTGTSTAQNPSHEYTSPGLYTVTLTATNADGSDGETKTDYIDVQSAVTRYYAISETTPQGTTTSDYSATFANDGSVETLTEGETKGSPSSRTSLLDHRWTFDLTAGLTMQFYLSAYRQDNSDGDNFEFEYSTDNSTYLPLVTVDSSAELIYQLPVPPSLDGTVYVRVTDTDRGRGNRSKDKLFVDEMYFETLTASIAPVADFVASTVSGGAPLNVQFTDLSAYGPTSWTWTFGDGGTSTLQNPSHTYTTPGDYDVSLTSTNAEGSDVETKVAYISVSSMPVIHIADITLGRSGNKWVRGTAAVTIVDAGGTPVSGVTVKGVFSAPNPATFTTSTGGSGVANFQSDRTRTPPVNWCFEVTEVTSSSAVYDPGSNVYNSRCEDGSSTDEAFAKAAAADNVLGELDNHPNPFNPSTLVTFKLDQSRSVKIEIFDQMGRRVALLADKVFSAGAHAIRWDASRQATGTYMYRMIADDFVSTKTMLLLK